MSTKLIIGGRVKARGMGDRRTLPATYELDEVQLERQAEALGLNIVQKRERALTVALPPMKSEGVPWYDAQDRITYKVSRNLAPTAGWGSMGFWMARWKVSADMVLHLTRSGLMDAATEPASAVKRYRCLDEKRTLAVIELERKRDAVRKSARQPPPANVTKSKRR